MRASQIGRKVAPDVNKRTARQWETLQARGQKSVNKKASADSYEAKGILTVLCKTQFRHHKGKSARERSRREGKSGGRMAERLNERMVGGKENIHADFEEFIFGQPSTSGSWASTSALLATHSLTLPAHTRAPHHPAPSLPLSLHPSPHPSPCA